MAANVRFGQDPCRSDFFIDFILEIFANDYIVLVCQCTSLRNEGTDKRRQSRRFRESISSSTPHEISLRSSAAHARSRYHFGAYRPYVRIFSNGISELELLINLYQDGWDGYDIDNYYFSVLGT